MKTQIFLFFTFFSTALISQSATETTIRKVIEEAGNGAYTNDYQRWADNWSEQEILFHYANATENYLFQDWPKLAAQMKENMGDTPSQQMPFVKRTNYKYKIAGNLAWVHFDQKDDHRVSKEQRILVKEGDQWKIVNMTAIDISSYEKKGLIRRLLYFSYKPETPQAEILLVKEKLQDMVPLVDGMDAAIWMDAPDRDSPYKHSLLLEFKHEKAVKAYEAHANHQMAIEKWQKYGDKLYGHTYQEK